MRIVLEETEETLANGKLAATLKGEVLSAGRRERKRRTEEQEASPSGVRSRVRYLAGLGAFLAVLLLPLGAGLMADASRGQERRLYGQAVDLLQEGRLEAAHALAREIGGRKFLSSTGRREAAALLLRLGYDREAHRLLLGRKPDPANALDRELRRLAAACQRAQAELAKIDFSQDPAIRVRHARQALAEVPESPGMLRRVVEEELLASTTVGDDGLRRAFAEHYRLLRERAPSMADDVKRRAGETLRRAE